MPTQWRQWMSARHAATCSVSFPPVGIQPPPRRWLMAVWWSSRAAAIEDHQTAISQRLGGGWIPTGGNETEHVAACLADIHCRHCVGIRTHYVEVFPIVAER